MINLKLELNDAKKTRSVLAGSKEYQEIDKIVKENSELLIKFNSESNEVIRNQILIKLFDNKLNNVVINPPFNTDFGRNTFLGKNVFINRNAMFVYLGGIYIDDNVLIAPNVTLISVNHMEKPEERHNLLLKAVHIKENAWIGANSIILPGVTIGKNAIVGAGSVVTKDVTDNTVVVGNPAKPVKKIK